MKEFKISDYLGDEIENILESRMIPYYRRSNGTIKVELSGNQFRRIVARAQCEKRNEQENLPADTSYWIPKVESRLDMAFHYPEYTKLIDFNQK